MQFEYSYTFAGPSAGAVITGKFWAEQDGDLFNDITDVTLNFAGHSYQGLIAAPWNSASPVVSKHLFENDFLFMHPLDYYPAFVLYFADGEFLAQLEDGVVNPVAAAPHVGAWFVRPASVPDAATTFLLLSTALGGVALLKRRFSGQSA